MFVVLDVSAVFKVRFQEYFPSQPPSYLLPLSVTFDLLSTLQCSCMQMYVYVCLRVRVFVFSRSSSLSPLPSELAALPPAKGYRP